METPNVNSQPEAIKKVVEERYAAIARGEVKSCCSSSGQVDVALTEVGAKALGYNPKELAAIPAGANLGLGCGDPTADADIQPGQTVLDLGSGAGIDCFLAARRVGPSGRVIGVDMTDAMLERARANAREGGITNVEFRKGEIEKLPVETGTVDRIISNCVINLSPDKDLVLAEAFRVLRPGGRLAVSDIVVRGEIPQAVRRNIELWAGCVAGALEEKEYLAKLQRAGFEQVTIEPTRVYTAADARELFEGTDLDLNTIAPLVDGKFLSGFVRATKPEASPVACCSTTCCS